MNAMLPWLKGGALAMLAAQGLLAQAAPVQTFSLHDARGLTAPQMKMEAAKYLGRESLRVTVEGEDQDGLALLPGTDFQDGVIEADIALKSTMAPGTRFPGFVGIAFRARSDASHYELFYLRPGNSQAPDQAMRNHTVQYLASPDYGWYRLRREWPSIYESHADIAMESWMHVRIEVAGRGAKLFLNGSSRPSLVVDGMRGEDLHGAVGLWGYTNQEAYFSNVRIEPATAQKLANGSAATGSWTLHFASDAGPMDATMQLHTDGSQVSGTWSGPLGQSLPVSGIWRNGYVDLSFAGEWPAGSPDGAPGPVSAFLAGWIDGDSGKGRMRVEGRADGAWSATRTQKEN
jgi:hypothetical protein